MTDHRMTGGPVPSPADDEPLDGWLAALAAEHNPPPPTPREEMWARIQAARARGGAGAAARPATPAAVPATAWRRRWLGPAAALAATLLVGVAIGRWSSLRPDDAGDVVAAATGPAVVPGTAPAGTLGPAVVVPEPAAEPVTEPAAPEGRTLEERGVAVPDARGGSPREGAASAGRGALAVPQRVYAAADAGEAPTGRGAAPLSAPGSAYQVATVQHLGQVEALLTAFRAEPPREGSAATLEPWARDLLTTTRLLLDSPAAADPRLGPLLGELETVLVQIVQLPAARAAEERQIIAQSLDEGDLLTQLRSAVPDGPAAPQRSGD